MTILIFAIGVILVAVGGRLAAHAISVPTLQLKRHLREIGEYGFQADPEFEPESGQAKSRGPVNGAVGALADGVGRFAIAHLPALRPLGSGDLAAA
jgi:hypothetical protein